MEIKKIATAGTMESSDAYVEIEPGNGGIQVTLESVVAQQFGDSIRGVVMEVLQEQQVVPEGFPGIFRVSSIRFAADSTATSPVPPMLDMHRPAVTPDSKG